MRNNFLNFKEYINKKEEEIKKYLKLKNINFKDFKRLAKEYEKIRNKAINENKLKKDAKELQNFESKYNQKFLDILIEYEIITKSKNIIDKFNLSNEDIFNIIKKNGIYLDYDDLMVNLTIEWVKDLNSKYKVVLEEFSNKYPNIKNKKEFEQKLYSFFANDLLVKKTKELKTYNKNWKNELIKIIEEEKIPKHLISRFYRKYRIQNFDNIINEKQLNSYYIFNSLPFGLDFLYKENLYMNDDMSQPVVFPYKDSIEFYNWLIKTGLIDYTYILTASFPGTEKSKREHIKYFFPEIIKRENIITTKKKEVVLKGSGILFDDSSPNVIRAVINTFAFCLNRKQETNIDYTIPGKRIYSIKSLKPEDVLIYFIYANLVIFERMQDQRLIKEFLLGTNHKEKEIINNLQF